MIASSGVWNSMACEACNAKFNWFKRKRQCMDCFRHFCSECVIKRLDKMLSCDSCSMLSRRPLVRSQISQMRPRDLRHYLLAKRVCVRGCVEKEDLVSLLMLFANGTNCRSNTEPEVNIRSTNFSEEPSRGSSSNRSDTSSMDNEQDGSGGSGANAGNGRNESIAGSTHETTARDGHIEIVEISATDSSSNESRGPEPVITEEDDSPEASEEQRSDDTFTEIPVVRGCKWSDLVKLSDISQLSELEYLSVKQLKNLLSTNRVDYKGCIERSELLDRACRLWEEHSQSRTDIEKLDEGDVCKICWDAPIECVILECGHMACCINCGKQMSECPICKQYVVRVVRFFKA